MILAADIGGTKANLGLFDVQQGNLARVARKRYLSHEHAGLREVIQDFLQENKAQITAGTKKCRTRMRPWTWPLGSYRKKMNVRKTVESLRKP